MSDLTYFYYENYKKYFVKFLHKLEIMLSTKLIKKSGSFFTGWFPWDGEPSSEIINNLITVTKIDTWEKGFPVQFTFDFRLSSGHVSQAQVYDYGRSVLYICTGGNDLFVLVFDKNNKNFYMASHEDYYILDSTSQSERISNYVNAIERMM